MADLKTRLLDILTRERMCLTQGEFASLPRLAEEKTRLAELLQRGPAPLSAEAVDTIRKACARNQRLFEASIAGLGAARDRLKAITQAQKGLKTYGGDGKVRNAADSAGTIERRA